MRWRTLFSLLLAVLLAVSTARARDEVTVTVDGETLDGTAFLQEDVTYIQLSALLEALGGWETVWDNQAGAATAVTGFFTLTVPFQCSHVLADACPYDTGRASLVLDGRTYVPLRSVANLLGAQVEFTGLDDPVQVLTTPERPYSEDDLYWLSRIINAESQGENLRGQIAVGNVILNRVDDPEFPDTIQAVVFDRKDGVQFEPVSNGTVYDEPTEQSVLAARLALAGADAAGDSLYFFNPSLSQGLWVRQNRTYCTTIGCHVFFE
ncbi:MAG: cell wall hydrolase [Oscillospiraceae bacterium]|nr:cell wall hydrolase [Oscillospiraceae bacterium]